ncbi:MAG: response regulator transcription factor [Acidimicrobiales bacterium]|nr:response regulator transcription factor [Acidimicrobiales bacterium]
MLADREPSPIRVLLVDDHVMMAESLRLILDCAADIEVVGSAANAHDGIAAAVRLRPDVVLMDYALPDVDGVTAAAQIAQERPATSVVVLTASGDDERLALRAMAAGCSGFLGKNGSVNDLLATVRAAHAGEAVIAPSMLARLVPRLDRGYAHVGDSLSRRELEVIAVMAKGGSATQIADDLTISRNTARKHVQNVIHKLGAHSKLEAVLIAVREGVIRPL